MKAMASSYGFVQGEVRTQGTLFQSPPDLSYRLLPPANANSAAARSVPHPLSHISQKPPHHLKDHANRCLLSFMHGRARRLRWNDGEDDRRWVLRVQINCVVRNLQSAVIVERLTRVWADVEPWEVAARDVEANPVAPLEHERHRKSRLNSYFQLGLAETIALSSAHDAISNIEIRTGRKVGVGRVYVNKFGCEIGTQSVRRHPEFHDEGSRNA